MKKAPRAMAILWAVAPAIAIEVAYRLFGYLGRPAAVHERERPVHRAATKEVLTIGGRSIVTYAWGTGPHTILLVHGWRSRASRFAALVRRLEGPDRTVVAFDAPGNGDSTGRGVTVLDYAEVVRGLAGRYGHFEAIVAHSFGVLASFIAVREGVIARRIVAFSGMYSADQLVQSFCAALGLPPQAVPRLARRISRRLFRQVANPWQRLVSELEPGGRPRIPSHRSRSRRLCRQFP